MTEALRLGFELGSSFYNWIGLYTNLGNSYASLGASENAIAILKKGLDEAYSGNRALAYFNLAHYYHQEGQYEEALGNYQRAIDTGLSNKAEAEKRIRELERRLGR